MSGPLSILHCLRAPVGGLFRHVCDLAVEQAAMGHQVGLICDARRADQSAEDMLRILADESCVLGVHRVSMSRGVGPGDFLSAGAVRRIVRNASADIVHGHGAKGGAYARIAAHALKRKGQIIRALYTPHGGSLHYGPHSLMGQIVIALERRLAGRTDGLIFESAYSEEKYQVNIGDFECEARVIHNGLKPHEFYEAALDIDACDFVFVGELRRLKGVDVLLHVLAELRKTRPVSAWIAGDGPDAGKFRALARRLKLDDAVTFAGVVPARTAFTRGRCLVVPSRAESFPYVVLEAGAARIPVIATNVGGIPEMVEGTKVELVAPDDVDYLTRVMSSFLDKPEVFTKRAKVFQDIIAERFTVGAMARDITHFYRSLLPAGWTG